ncbi:MAG TPA: SCO family protein [Acetobacteraceae bacterium]|nr:SCO family protein [Acetobacteraceae bacterium]
MNRRNFLAGIAAGGATAASARVALARTPARDYPNPLLRTHEGKAVRFYDDLLKNKVVVINFMFAQCGDICPTMTENLVAVQARLGERVGRSIFMYSLTLEPERDTPEALKEYAEAFSVGPGWLFLTGAPADIELLRRTLGFADLSDPVLDADRTQHIGLVRFGNVRLDRWTACPALTNPDEIAREILWVA